MECRELAWHCFVCTPLVEHVDTSSLTKDLNGNFLFDLRTSTLSIDGTAFLGKVLVDFRPRCYSGAGFRALRDRAAQNWPFAAQWEPLCTQVRARTGPCDRL